MQKLSACIAQYELKYGARLQTPNKQIDNQPLTPCGVKGWQGCQI
jgi:hypothetical protein